MSIFDLSVSFPSRGMIRLQSPTLFGDADSPTCRCFLERVFSAEEVSGVTLTAGPAPAAEIRFCPDTSSLQEVVGRIAALLTGSHDTGEPTPLANGHAHANGNGKANVHGLASPGRFVRPHARAGGNGVKVSVAGTRTARDRKGVVRYHRHDTVATGWQVKREQAGRLKLKNPVLYRKNELCQAIERELMSILGIDKYTTNSLFCTVQIDYDPRQLSKGQVIEILDSALAAAEHPKTLDKLDLHLPVCTASLPLAAVAQFAVPGLLPVAAVVFAYTSVPTFKAAREVLVDEKRLGVDVLDAIVVVGCLGTMAIFPGAVLCWCLSFGRVLVKRTQDNSKKLLLNAFGKHPRYAWLYRDGVEVQVALDRLAKGDIIVVNTGEGHARRRPRRRGDGGDRPARPDGRIDPGRKRRRRPSVRVDGDGRGQGLRVGRAGGQRDGLGQDQPDPERHGRV